MNYTTILFDLDGTILDTGEDLQHSLNHVLEKYGMPPRSLADTRRFLGNGIRRLIELGAGEGVSADTLDAMFSDFKAYYRLHCLDRTRPYEGIVPLLTSLREAGAKTAVVSNKADFAVQSLAERFFPGLFDFAVGEREGIRRKPCPDSVLEALSRLNADRERAVYIGDSEVDIATARNAGLPCLSVTWGFRSQEALLESGAERLVHSPEELREIIGL